MTQFEQVGTIMKNKYEQVWSRIDKYEKQYEQVWNNASMETWNFPQQKSREFPPAFPDLTKTPCLGSWRQVFSV